MLADALSRCDSSVKENVAISLLRSNNMCCFHLWLRSVGGGSSQEG